MHYKHIGIVEMANKIGISESSMSTLIAGRRNITPTLAKKIGGVLDIDPLVIMTNRMCEELQKGE
jgi:plasmid maintenance system antidote protein VapI